MLAFQIGNSVSYSEIATSVGADHKTVMKYTNLLEKSFIIFRIGGYSKNLRKEINKKNKFYFYDLGIRNAVISNFRKIEARPDKGAMWENFIMTELLKKEREHSPRHHLYFRRTWDGQEIDIVREYNGKFLLYECKWNLSKAKKTALAQWGKTYDNWQFSVVSSENYLKILGIE